MAGKFIIVEGALDQQLLAAILPVLPAQIKLVAAGGYSAALSKAATVLSYLHQDALLVLDADTTDDQAAAEKKQFVYDYLKSSRNGSRFELILFKPSLAAYLAGSDEQFATKYKQLNRSLSIEHITLPPEANPAHFEQYQQLPEIKEIMSFVQE